MKKIKSYLILINIIVFSTPLSVYATCTEYCKDLAPAVRLVKYGLIPLFQLIVPIGLIVMGMIDLSKAVMAGKEEEMKKSSSMFVKRCIYGVAIFFVMTIVTLVMEMFKETNTGVEGTEEWWQCYSSVDECRDDIPETPKEEKKACYYCNSTKKYKWLKINSKSSKNCSLKNEFITKNACTQNNKKTTKPQKNNNSGTGSSSGGTPNFDNKGYGTIGTFTSASGKKYKNYKQCYNQYGNTGKASQYTWLCHQGCGLTSAAIIISSVKPSVNPEYIWDTYRKSKEPNGVPVSNYFTHYGLTVQSKDNEETGSDTSTFTKQELINHLKSGGGAVLRFTASPCVINGEQWTRANHYVAALGYRTSDDSIYISNPGDAWAKNGWYKIDSLLGAKTCKVRITHLAK